MSATMAPWIRASKTRCGRYCLSATLIRSGSRLALALTLSSFPHRALTLNRAVDLRPSVKVMCEGQTWSQQPCEAAFCQSRRLTDHLNSWYFMDFIAISIYLSHPPSSSSSSLTSPHGVRCDLYYATRPSDHCSTSSKGSRPSSPLALLGVRPHSHPATHKGPPTHQGPTQHHAGREVLRLRLWLSSLGHRKDIVLRFAPGGGPIPAMGRADSERPAVILAMELLHALVLNPKIEGFDENSLIFASGYGMPSFIMA